MGMFIAGVGACLVFRFSPTCKFVNKSVVGHKPNDGVKLTNNYKKSPANTGLLKSNYCFLQILINYTQEICFAS